MSRRDRIAEFVHTFVHTSPPISLGTVIDAADLAKDFVPVPGLGPAISALRIIYDSLMKVSINRKECEGLYANAVEVLIVIRDNRETAESEKFEKAVEKANATLKSIRDDVLTWSEMGFWKSWYLQNEIEGCIEDHTASLDMCVRMLGLSIGFQINAAVQRIDAGRIEDRKALKELRDKQDEMYARVTSLQETLVTAHVDSTEHIIARKELFQIRHGAHGYQPICPVDLRGECVIVEKTATYQGSRYDIWRGQWLGGPFVALKVARRDPSSVHVPERNRARLERQVKLWRALNHPNVLRLFGWCTLDDEVYLVSPWLDNGNVLDFLRHGIHMDEDKINLMRDIANGLKYLHSQHIIHGGLQPSNVLVEDDGHAVLGDFALAKLLESSGDGPDQGPINTQSDGHFDDLRYQAPEVSSHQPMSFASDVHAWAMTSLEIASGRPPLPDIRYSGLLARAVMVDNRHPLLAEHPCSVFNTYPNLWPLLESCWQPNPVDRPSLDHVLQVLDSFSADATL